MKCVLCIVSLMIFFASVAQAGIAEDLQQGQAKTKEQTVETTTQLPPICQGTPDHAKCYEVFDRKFHKALNNNKPIFLECLRRANVLLPDDVIETLAKGPITVPNGDKVNLVQALKIVAKENSSKTSACLLALTHAICDDMAREFGIKAPEVDHLSRFDKSEQEYRKREPVSADD